jgi:hypothetical protein
VKGRYLKNEVIKMMHKGQVKPIVTGRLRLKTEQELTLEGYEKELKQTRTRLKQLEEKKRGLYVSKERETEFGWRLAKELEIKPDDQDWREAIFKSLILYQNSSFVATRGVRTHRVGVLAEKIGKPVQHSYIKRTVIPRCLA